MELIKTIFAAIATMIIVILAAVFIIAGLIFSLYTTFEFADYIFDNTQCSVYVEDKLEYSGRCHYISISSIGENGFTKDVTIYKDVLNLRVEKHIVNDDIRIEGDLNGLH